ncbi:hypothetical protein DL98DRAFT_636989 [Cadophora sp. DSE1049]|nr:hypothetical protein DL98DRAFT_636989 [Cadophora sp. DSE1049]
MKTFFLFLCLVLSSLLAATSPGNSIEAGAATDTAYPPTSLSNNVHVRAPVIPEPFLPAPCHENRAQLPGSAHLINRAKGQKGDGKSNGEKTSKADKMIMNQKLQASNRDVILGWTLGVYGFLGFLALVAWHFDILPGFGRSVESILEGQHDQKER